MEKCRAITCERRADFHGEYEGYCRECYEDILRARAANKKSDAKDRAMEDAEREGEEFDEIEWEAEYERRLKEKDDYKY